jgi:hypothetical protein
MDKNYSFILTADLEKYTGKWVAIADGKLVASGVDAKRVYNEAKKKHPKEELLLDKVYGKKVLVV